MHRPPPPPPQKKKKKKWNTQSCVIRHIALYTLFVCKSQPWNAWSADQREIISRTNDPRGSPDRKVHGANMRPIWGRQDPGGPHVGPMNFSIWEIIKIRSEILSPVFIFLSLQPDTYSMFLYDALISWAQLATELMGNQTTPNATSVIRNGTLMFDSIRNRQFEGRSYIHSW